MAVSGAAKEWLSGRTLPKTPSQFTIFLQTMKPVQLPGM